MVEEDAAGRREFYAMRASSHELSADRVLEIPHLPAQGRLRRM
jgi:hypothetical protein